MRNEFAAEDINIFTQRMQLVNCRLSVSNQRKQTGRDREGGREREKGVKGGIDSENHRYVIGDSESLHRFLSKFASLKKSYD